jgi:hypothetical protein
MRCSRRDYKGSGYFLHPIGPDAPRPHRRRPPPAPAGAGHAADLLRDDHRQVKSLFKQFEEAEDPQSKQRIIEQALKALLIHSAIEEEIIYPALTDELAEETIDEAFEEHHIAKVLISELWKMQPSSQRYDAKFTILAEAVKHHIEEEESELLPGLDDGDLLAEQIVERKEELEAELEETGTLPNEGRLTEKKLAAGAGGRKGTAKTRAAESAGRANRTGSPTGTRGR